MFSTDSDLAREHLDHVEGSRTEFQNCYEQSRRELVTSLDVHTDAAREAADAGKVAMVLSCTEYCRVTDAIVGQKAFAHYVGETREEVLAQLPAYSEDFWEDTSSKWYGLPAPAPTPASPEEDECPL